MTSSTTYSEASPDKPANSATRVATASFIGTAIEFYDFYVYATAAALVIGPVFFPPTSGTAQMLSAFLTFGIAFLARPLGSFLFGHFGDRIGRKSTLVASLLLMGVCTTLIGVLPGYATIGAWAPILLCVLRFPLSNRYMQKVLRFLHIRESGEENKALEQQLEEVVIKRHVQPLRA